MKQKNKCFTKIIFILGIYGKTRDSLSLVACRNYTKGSNVGQQLKHANTNKIHAEKLDLNATHQTTEETKTIEQ